MERTGQMATVNEDNAQEVVSDLNTAEYYLPEDLKPSLMKTIRFLAERFDVIDDDAELETQ